MLTKRSLLASGMSAAAVMSIGRIAAAQAGNLQLVFVGHEL